MSDHQGSVSVPVNYPTALIAIDESGSKSSGGGFFVMGAVKVRATGSLLREVQHVRDRHGFRGEFKFSELTNGSLAVCYDLIAALSASDATLHATVVDRSHYDAFAGKEQWEVHRDVASLLLRGCINRRELVSTMLDHVSTPADVFLADEIRSQVNRKLGNGSVVTAFSADSRSSDLLQLADLVASAIRFDRWRRCGRHAASKSSPKALVTNCLLTTWGSTCFDDTRQPRLNVLTLDGPRAPRRTRLRSVPSASA